MFALLPFSVGPWELIVVLVIVLIIVGPGKLPSVGKAIGRSISEFRRAREINSVEEDDNDKKSKE